jgi:lipopolysaccharide export system permease protein
MASFGESSAFNVGCSVFVFCFPQQRVLTLPVAFSCSSQPLKTLHLYLLRQIAATLLMTAAVFTFVLLLGNILRDILPLLMSQKATFGRIAEAFVLLIPFVAVWVLPMGMLTATLLVFGRFSADQELTAAKASGISLVSLATPVLLFSLILSALSGYVNLDLGPRSRVAFKELLFSFKANLAMLQLPERRYFTLEGKEADHTIWIEKAKGAELTGVRVLRIQNETNLELTIDAPRGRLERDVPNRKMILHLYDANLLYIGSDLYPATLAEMPISLDLDQASKTSGKPGITDMTFTELCDELQGMEKRLGTAVEIDKPDPEKADRKKQSLKRQLTDITEPYRMQIHRRVAFSFACFGFTLIGIPLGIRVHRRETNIGIVVALLLVAVYYGLLIIAESLTSRPEIAPHILMWLPNFVFQAVGAVLLWRANRGV